MAVVNVQSLLPCLTTVFLTAHITTTTLQLHKLVIVVDVYSITSLQLAASCRQGSAMFTIVGPLAFSTVGLVMAANAFFTWRPNLTALTPAVEAAFVLVLLTPLALFLFQSILRG